MSFNLVALSFGSNIGDRDFFIESAKIECSSFFSSIFYSDIVDSEPLLPEGSPSCWNTRFLNVCAIAVSSLCPLEILDHLQYIENKLGREKLDNRKKWSPREIDIDILYYNNILLQTQRLTIPHREVHQRDFVIEPMLDVISYTQDIMPGLNIREIWKKKLLFNRNFKSSKK